ncbi:hypothetical protein TNCV_749801 [Trichonephila clavipes]|nr:hypothetical protein TNCV_749801 [Trichonephila clavipes]
MHMGKYHLLAIVNSGYRNFVENVELSPTVPHNACPDDNSRTMVTVSFRDITGMQPCPDFFSKQLTLKIDCGT